MIKKENKFLAAFYTLFFILFTIIMLLSPHTVDDTYYDYLNMNNFFDILHFSAGYGNGRILGNLFSIYLCKSNIIAAIARALTVTLMIYFISKITSDNDKQNAIAAPTAAFILIGIGAIFFGEVYAWISAFTNYVPPILAMFICIDQIKGYNKLSISKLIIVFIFGFSSQLFSENSSLNNFIIACSVLIFCFFNNKSRLTIAIDFALSTALGAAAMVLCRLFCKDDRSFYADAAAYHSGISIKTIVYNISKYAYWFSECKILWILLSAMLIIIISKSNIKNTLKLLLSVSLILYPVYCCFCYQQYETVNYYGLLAYIPVIISIALIAIYLAAAIYTGYLLNNKYKKAFLFTIIFALFTAVYLLVLSPINSRCLFYTYCVMLIALLIAGKAAFKQIDINIKAVQASVCLLVTAVFISIVPIYASMAIMNNKVNDYITNQIEHGNTTVTVCKITNTEYMHHSYCSGRLGWIYYQNEPKDVEFEEVSISDWLNNYDAK